MNETTRKIMTAYENGELDRLVAGWKATTVKKNPTEGDFISLLLDLLYAMAEGDYSDASMSGLSVRKVQGGVSIFVTDHRTF